MASSSTICASCLRMARSTVTKRHAQPTTATTQIIRAYRSAAPRATSPSLYLDFLAPSSPRRASRHNSAQRLAFLQPQHIPRRALATSSEASTAKPAQAIQNPRTDDSGNPMLISIAPRASNRLQKISTGDNNPNLALRVSVESGGCHGFQYLMDLTDLSKNPATEEDTIFEGEKGEKIVIDEPSLELLNGSTVDYTMELIGSQFKITGIPGATSSCGCGTSFDIKI
jgi:iron-sulfur cluster assembly accessory protein